MKSVKSEFNFLPAPILEEREKRRKIIMISPLLVIVALLIGGGFFFPIYLEKQLQAQIDKTNRAYSHLAPAVSYYNEAQSLQAAYDKNRQAIAEIKKTRVDLVEIIDGISSVLPPDVYVTSLSVTAAQGITLVFETDSALRTAQFIVGLRTLPYFEQVEPKQVPLRGSTEEVVLELLFKGVKATPPAGE